MRVKENGLNLVFWEPIVWVDANYLAFGYERQVWCVVLAMAVMAAVFFIGFGGFLVGSRSVMFLLIYSELLLFSLNLLYLLLSVFIGDAHLQVLSLLLLVLAGIDSVVGLSLVYVLYQRNQTTQLPFL